MMSTLKFEVTSRCLGGPSEVGDGNVEETEG
jgi:hypothetical protein